MPKARSGEHLSDVELTDAQDDRATALEPDVIRRPASAACEIIWLRDRIAELESRLELYGTNGAGERVRLPDHLDGIACRDETIRQQESQLRTALDKLRQPAIPTRERLMEYIRTILGGTTSDGIYCGRCPSALYNEMFDELERAAVAMPSMACPGAWPECPRADCQTQMRCVHGAASTTGESR